MKAESQSKFINSPKMASLIFLSSLLLTVSLSVSAAAAADHKKSICGNWEPIKNISDPHVQEIARFAVVEHNKHTHDQLKLITVVRGEYQRCISGINYCLVIVASSGDFFGKFQATVFGNSWELIRELTSFEPIDVPGSWKPIKNLSDPHVQEIAIFAVDVSNQHSHMPLKLITVVSGEYQFVCGFNYTLVIEASYGGFYGRYKTIVYEKSWGNIPKLISFYSIDIPSSWELIKNLSDPHVQEIARFAVDEINKHAQNQLKLITVVSGEYRIVSGIIYRLIIEVSSDGFSGKYMVFVFEKREEHIHKLMYFQPIDLLGGWEPIKNLSDPHVQEIVME